MREDATALAAGLMCASNVQLAVEQDAWNAALARARGERILDDPKLLSRCGAWLLLPRTGGTDEALGNEQEWSEPCIERPDHGSQGHIGLLTAQKWMPLNTSAWLQGVSLHSLLRRECAACLRPAAW